MFSKNILLKGTCSTLSVSIISLKGTCIYHTFKALENILIDISFLLFSPLLENSVLDCKQLLISFYCGYF